MRIAVLCPSEIASRRFMPALACIAEASYVGVGVATADERCVGLPHAAADAAAAARQHQKAEVFAANHGGRIFKSYRELLDSPDVDAIYIPLPPALHHPWAKAALEAGKHVLLEKPFTTSAAHTRDLLEIARERSLAVHENYMFAFHSQIDWVRETISQGTLGDVRLVRVDFGFPFRGADDFRYSKELGGGALLDCGGYTLKLASLLLGDTAHVTTAQLSQTADANVDVYGSATLMNDVGAVAQVSFGMDNDYRCDLDVWGSKATLRSNRILTAPAGFEPTMQVRRNGMEETFTLPSDDSFRKSIEHFMRCIEKPETAKENARAILHQAELVETVMATTR